MAIPLRSIATSELCVRALMNIVIYIVATTIGVYFSYIGLGFATLHGRQFYSLIQGLVLVAYIGSFLFARKKAIQGNVLLASLALVSPMVQVALAGQVYMIGKHIVFLLSPNSPAFTKECQTVGAQYYNLPASPVRSIAYVWQTKVDPSYLNVFTVNFGNRLNSRAHYGYTYPATIEFTERPSAMKHEGLTRSYFHIPREGGGYELPNLTADVVVEYRITPEAEFEKATSEQGMINYELTVTDRRDGQKLAFLRYIVDEKNRRACGLTGDNMMDQRAFLLKAIGQQ